MGFQIGESQVPSLPLEWAIPPPPAYEELQKVDASTQTDLTWELMSVRCRRRLPTYQEVMGESVKREVPTMLAEEEVRQEMELYQRLTQALSRPPSLQEAEQALTNQRMWTASLNVSGVSERGEVEEWTEFHATVS